MRRVLVLILAAPVALSSFLPLSRVPWPLCARMSRGLHREEIELDRDRDRLLFDRRAHAPRTQIRLDQLQIKRDRLEIRQLKADIPYA